MSLAPAGRTRCTRERLPTERQRSSAHPCRRFLYHPSSMQLRFARGQRGCRTRTGTTPARSLPGGGARSKVRNRHERARVNQPITKNVDLLARLRPDGQGRRLDHLVRRHRPRGRQSLPHPQDAPPSVRLSAVQLRLSLLGGEMSPFMHERGNKYKHSYIKLQGGIQDCWHTAL